MSGSASSTPATSPFAQLSLGSRSSTSSPSCSGGSRAPTPKSPTGFSPPRTGVTETKPKAKPPIAVGGGKETPEGIRGGRPSRSTPSQTSSSEDPSESEEDALEFGTPADYYDIPEEPGLSPVEEPEWYPHKASKNPHGAATKIYLQLLKKAWSDHSTAVSSLRLAEQLVVHLDCQLSEQVWGTIRGLLFFLEANQMTSIAGTLAGYLLSNQDALGPFLTAVELMKPHLRRLHESVRQLKSATDELLVTAKTAETTLQSIRDVPAKMNEQINNTHQTLARLQEIVESRADVQRPIMC